MCKKEYTVFIGFEWDPEINTRQQTDETKLVYGYYSENNSNIINVLVILICFRLLSEGHIFHIDFVLW